MGDDLDANKKRHNKRAAGRKAEKKDKKKGHVQELTAKQRNPKAFTVRSVVNASKTLRRAQDLKEKRTHIPVIDRTTLEPPPIVISIVGPPKVGKSTLMRCLIKNFTRKNMTDIQGPVTIVSGKKRRLTLIECNNDINSMIDVAKVTDLVLLLVDASFGFEMETFEFLNICQVHGFPRVMGVLTHLDMFKDNKKLRKIKKTLKHRFWTDVYPGAKLFYLSGMVHGGYQRMEVHNLGRFIAVMKFRPLEWRQNHPYLLIDRLEDLTSAEQVRQDAKCDRRVSVYGYVRGVPLRADTPVHIAGVGDFRLASVDFLPDPCPLPERKAKSRRSLTEMERSLYAPMSGVGGIVYDKDAVYIELRGSHSHSENKIIESVGSQVNGKTPAIEESKEKTEVVKSEDVAMLDSLKESVVTLDERMASAEVQLFSDQKPLLSRDAEMGLQYETVSTVDGRLRRKVVFGDEGEEANEDSGQESDSGSQEHLDDAESEVDSNDEDMDDESKADLNARSEDGNLNSYLPTAKTSAGDSLNIGSFSSSQNARQLRKIIYDTPLNNNSKDDDDDDMAEEVGGLFRVRRSERKANSAGGCDCRDTSRPAWLAVRVAAWTQPSEKDRTLLAGCFTTGAWKQSENAAALLDMNVDDLCSDDADGDFEDLEGGVEHHGRSSSELADKSIDVDSLPVKKEEEKLSRKQMIEKKKRLKAMFDAEYDNKESSGFYDDLKRDLEQQAQINRSEFESLEDSERVQYEGYRAGMYVRLEITGVPCELVDNFDASYPLVVGGLSAGEQNIGYVQARIKRHRWYGRTLKTRDPLIISLGWRRFQTVPLFSAQDHNGRHRLLKYTPDHLHCVAHFFGPITPQGSGLLALQTAGDGSGTSVGRDFRVAATGVVLDLDKSVSVVKKLKLVGQPQQVLKKTAFVGGMFSSTVEAARFEGALCRTVSGIRGHVKRALLGKPGVVRCTFEDAVKMSDLVFIRTWYSVSVPRLYAPVCSLLLPIGQKSSWSGMKTVGQLKRERAIRAPAAVDSLYTPVMRRERRPPRPLHVPAQLMKQLPYADRVKLNNRVGVKAAPPLRPDGQPAEPSRQLQPVAVVLQPREQQVQRVLSTVRALHELQEERRQVVASRRIARMAARHQQELDKFDKRQKRVRKHLYKVLAKQQQSKSR